ncbi:hypothetical protein AMTRI_Chr12g267960 [Amborella trichopoda]
MGKVPFIWFPVMPRRTRLVQFPKLDGILPDKEFHDKPKSFKRCSRPIAAGMLPCRLLTLKFKCSKLARFPISNGMLPSTTLKLRSRLFKRDKRPISLGMFPWKMLSERLREVREERLPMCGLMVPPKEEDLRSSVTTLSFCRSHVTPCQSHTRTLAFHELNTPYGSRFTSLLNW